MFKTIWYVLDIIADILRLIILMCAIVCVARGIVEFTVDLINWIENVQ